MKKLLLVSVAIVAAMIAVKLFWSKDQAAFSVTLTELPSLSLALPKEEQSPDSITSQPAVLPIDIVHIDEPVSPLVEQIVDHSAPEQISVEPTKTVKKITQEQMSLIHSLALDSEFNGLFEQLLDDPALANVLGYFDSRRYIKTGYSPLASEALRQIIIAVYGTRLSDVSALCNARGCIALADFSHDEVFEPEEFCQQNKQSGQYNTCQEGQYDQVVPEAFDLFSVASLSTCMAYHSDLLGLQDIDFNDEANGFILSNCVNLSYIKAARLKPEIDKLLACQQAAQTKACLQAVTIAAAENSAVIREVKFKPSYSLNVKFNTRLNDTLQNLPLHPERLLTGDTLESRLSEFVINQLDTFNQTNNSRAQLTSMRCEEFFCQLSISNSRKTEFHRDWVANISQELHLTPWCKANDPLDAHLGFPLDPQANIWHNQQFECVFVQGPY